MIPTIPKQVFQSEVKKQLQSYTGDKLSFLDGISFYQKLLLKEMEKKLEENEKS